ncbi:MAG: MBOAT family O-acyltransferase [Acidobacteriota bacterium]
MLLTSPEYYCVLIFVFFAFWLVRARQLPALGLILAVNLFFYAKWGLIYLLLVPAAATCDFFLARAMYRQPPGKFRRLLLAASLFINVGLIVFCRYMPPTRLLLPLSLSFYAFQALTYTIDIYRQDAKPVSSYLACITSVTFFPTVVAGPITRVAALAPQWNWKGKTLSAAEGSRALFLIGLGLFKKFLIADYLAANLVNRVFDLPALYSGGDVLAAVYGYAFQLYYDFSGYSDIAIGSALLLGIRLPANFNLPYRALNIADFWRRWHITFSNWLRDYLYFALPGPRTKVMPYLNLIVTMAVGGLWHGANRTFLIWGVLHGAGLAIFRLWHAWRKNARPSSRLAGKLGARLLTFHFVLLGWVFFRAANVETALTVLRQISTSVTSLRFSFDNVTPAFFAVLLFAALAHFLPVKWFDTGLQWFERTPAALQAASLALLVVAIQLVASTGAAPFIYSKF